jgi:hypothetical protein
VQQHAGGRIILDSKSAAVTAKNVTSMVVNTWWSFTNLAAGMKTETGETPAFRLLMTRIQYLADVGGLIFQTSDDKLLAVGELPGI